MDALKAIGVRRGITLGIIALALILATLIAPPGAEADVDVYLDENDRTAVTEEFAATILALNAAYPETGDVVISVEPLDEVMAFGGTTFDGTIILNEFYAENPGAFIADVNANVQGGYFPSGCSPAQLVAVHEFGHVMEWVRGDRPADVVYNTYGTGVGLAGLLPGYSFDEFGELKPSEALANAFAAVHCGTANSLEHNLYQILVTTS